MSITTASTALGLGKKWNDRAIAASRPDQIRLRLRLRCVRITALKALAIEQRDLCASRLPLPSVHGQSKQDIRSEGTKNGSGHAQRSLRVVASYRA